MANPEKQKAKLRDRIAQLESELQTSLHKKTAGPAIDVPGYTTKIRDLKAQLAAIK